VITMAAFYSFVLTRGRNRQWRSKGASGGTWPRAHQHAFWSQI